MPWTASRFIVLLSLLLLGACGGGDSGGGGGGTGPAPGLSNSLTLQPVATSTVFSSPLFLTAPIGNSSETRLFIVEQGGLIRIVDVSSGALIGTYLDLSSRVLSGGERGLLGMAFDPDYATNGFFYVYYTSRATGAIAAGDIVIARYQANPPTNNVASSTETVLKTIPHPTNANHNGGMLAFGPDRCLYAGVGDGGGSGDPPNNAQTKTTLLGKIL